MHPDGRLDYIGYETFDGVLDYPVSAHPVVDGDNLLFHSYSVDEELIKEHGTMKVGRYNSQTAAVDTYLVPTPTKSHVSFAHSLMHTDNYIIVWDCSVHFKTDALFMGGSFFRNIQDYTLKFGLIPKEAKSHEEVIWIDSGECGAIVHPLHAWEEVVEEDEDGGARTIIKLWAPVCLDLDLDLEKANTFHMTEYTVRYLRNEILDVMYSLQISSLIIHFPHSQIDPKAGTATQVVIDDTINSEFSTMPPKSSQSSLQCSSPSFLASNVATFETSTRGFTPKTIGSTLSIHDRYGFTAVFGDNGHFIGYAKWDLVSRCLHSTVYYTNNEVGGEPMVVRVKEQADGRGNGTEEEVVYVGSYVYNEELNESFFLLFDGETNEQVCRLKMPSRVPFGFHGQFISGDEFASHFQYHEALEKGPHTQCPIQWIRFFIRDFILEYPHDLWSPHLSKSVKQATQGEVEKKE